MLSKFDGCLRDQSLALFYSVNVRSAFPLSVILSSSTVMFPCVFLQSLFSFIPVFSFSLSVFSLSSCSWRSFSRRALTSAAFLAMISRCFLFSFFCSSSSSGSDSYFSTLTFFPSHQPNRQSFS